MCRFRGGECRAVARSCREKHARRSIYKEAAEKGESIDAEIVLQEDKEPLFDSVETIVAMLKVSTEFAQNISFNKERITKSLPAGHLDATTMANYLVYKRIPFCTSHDIVGKLVALAVSKRCQISELSLNELYSINPIFDEDVYNYLGAESAINKFESFGSDAVSTGSSIMPQKKNPDPMELVRGQHCVG